MSAEFWAIIGVGGALGVLISHLTGRLRGEIADLQERMAKVATLALLVRSLRIEIRERRDA